MEENNKLPSELTEIKPLADPEALLDGWGSEIFYEYSEDDSSYQLISAGPDRQYDTEDDINMGAALVQQFAPK